MTVKSLVLLPDPILRKVSKPLERVDDDVRRFANDMFDTMYDAPGIGLAAIQVGEPLRMVTVDISSKDEEMSPLVLINPEIVEMKGEATVFEEGCLSIPDYYADVERPGEIVVTYLDLDGKSQTLNADGVLSTCIQHEVDHLNGVLFIDHISKLKRQMVVRKFSKLAKIRGTTLL